MEIKIEGMSCGHCEGRVKSELEKVGAVVELVSASDGKAVVAGVDDAVAVDVGGDNPIAGTS